MAENLQRNPQFFDVSLHLRNLRPSKSSQLLTIVGDAAHCFCDFGKGEPGAANRSTKASCSNTSAPYTLRPDTRRTRGKTPRCS